jgi:predicted small secreted protein
MMSSRQDSFATRSLAVLQRLGGWVAIHPEQTYVATSIRGIGSCKSTFCPAERRELPAGPRAGSGVVPLLVALAAAAGVLSACATDRPLGRDVTDLGRFERAPEDCQRDCQNRAAPVRGRGTAGAGGSTESAAVGAGFVEVPKAPSATASGRASKRAEAAAGVVEIALRNAEHVAAR